MAMLRAVSALERDPLVRNPDFLAKPFLADSPLFRFLLRSVSLRVLHSLAKWSFERVGPGTYWMEIARVKHFDAILLREVSRGARQVVILGAGLDSRAYRFERELQGARLIEVDQPGMVAHKRARVEATLGGPPPNVAYLPLDLTKRELPDGLAETFFDPASPVAVLWIGVSMYLDSEAVSSVLRWVAERPPGSSIGFDYLTRDYFEDERPFGVPRRTRRIMELSGEPFRFGLDPVAVPAVLHAHGLSVCSHLSPADLEQRYLLRSDGSAAGRSNSYLAFVHAAVSR